MDNTRARQLGKMKNEEVSRELTGNNPSYYL
jgi:hypothetical protein